MATSTYEIERRARAEGETETDIQHLRIAVGELAREIRQILWILVPLGFVSFVLSLVALILVLLLVSR